MENRDRGRVIRGPPRGFRVVDPHIHLWDLTRFPYPWLTTQYDASAPFAPYQSICRNYLVPDLLTDAPDVDLEKAVHISAAVDLFDPVMETAWVQSQSDINEFPLAIIASADLTSTTLSRQLDRHSQFHGFRGVRMLSFGQDIFGSSQAQRSLKQLQNADLVCDVDAELSHYDSIVSAAHRHSSLCMVVGHAGLPIRRSPEYFRCWKKGVDALKSTDNVMCKISGLGMYDHSWTTESLKPWIDSCLESFGVDRCMFASNWPVDRIFSSYGEVFDAYAEITKDFEQHEKTKLFSGNAERIYRI